MSDLRTFLVPLARWRETNALSQNEERILTPSAGNGELVEGRWVAEISHVEIITESTAIAPADIQDVMLRLDGGTVYPHVRWNGRMDASTAPPVSPARLVEQGSKITLHTLGLPIGSAPYIQGTRNRDPRYCTMPKYKRSVGLQYTARSAVSNGVARMFVVWGYLYPADQVPSLIGNVGGSFTLVDRLRDRVTHVDYPVKIASHQTWTQLPGGQDQGQPAIWPFLRDSINASNTTPNDPYQFRMTGDFVARDNQELYWPYQIENNALWIRRLGVRAVDANLRALIIRLGDEEYPSRRGQTQALRG